MACVEADIPGSGMDVRTRTPVFTEGLSARFRRWVFGMIYAVMPQRARLLPHLAVLTLAHLVAPESVRDGFSATPHFRSERGLAGISNDLSVEAILANYRRGLFPVCHIGPMKWWSPAARAVCSPEETHVSKNVLRLMRQRKFHATMDCDFAGVMRACAEPREGHAPLTWITPRIMSAYWALHQAGYAHSVEYGTTTAVWSAGSTGSPSATSSSASRSSRAPSIRRRSRSRCCTVISRGGATRYAMASG